MSTITKRNIASYGIVAATLIAAVLVDLILTPGRTTFITYALPTVVAAYLLPARSTALTAVLAIGLSVAASFLEGIAPSIWTLNGAILVIVTALLALVSVLVSSQRQALASGAGELRDVNEELRQEVARRKKSEEERGRYLEQLRAVLGHMPVGVWVIDRAGRIEMGNPAAERIWGGVRHVGLAEYGEYKGWWLDTGKPIAPEDWAGARAVTRGEKSLNEVVEIEAFDGTHKIIVNSAVPLRDETQAITGAIVVNEDITEQRRIQEERDRLLEDLRSTNEQLVITSLQEQERAGEARRRAAELDTTIRSIADGVAIYGAQGEIIRMNPAAASILGYTDEQARLPAADRLALLHAETVERNPFPPEEVPGVRALNGETVHGTLMVMHPSPERTVWATVSAAPIRAADDRLLGAVSIFTDVTELHDLEEQREDFVRMVSHDLRSPLTAILGNAALLQRLLAKRGLVTEGNTADAVVRNARRMNSMIQEMTDSVRLEARQFEMHKVPTSLTDVVLDIVDRFGSPEERERIRVELAESAPTALMDPDRFERAITNLLSNAMKYSPPGSPVIIRIDQRDSEAIISVADEGRGIAAADFPHLFERYYRTSAGNKAAEGLGLGLYIARLIVEAHNGRIWVESTVGKGTTFYIALPTT